MAQTHSAFMSCTGQRNGKHNIIRTFKFDSDFFFFLKQFGVVSSCFALLITTLSLPVSLSTKEVDVMENTEINRDEVRQPLLGLTR